MLVPSIGTATRGWRPHAGHEPVDREHGDADVVDVDTGTPGRLRAAADGVDVATERGRRDDERPEGEEEAEGDGDQRDTAIASWRPQTDPKREHPSPTICATTIRSGVDRRPRAAAAHGVELNEGVHGDARGTIAQPTSVDRKLLAMSTSRWSWMRMKPASEKSSRQPQHHTGPDEEPGQRRDERGHPEFGDDQRVEQPDRGRDAPARAEDACPPRPTRVTRPLEETS